MKIKDVEKKIISSLEDNSAPLNHHVLDAVKQEIRENKGRKRNTITKYAIAACLSVVICLAIVLPIVIKTSSGNTPVAYMETEITSMQDYYSSKGIVAKSFGQIIGGTSILEDQDDLIKKSECKVVSENHKKDVCLQETYTLINDDIITVSMLLVPDENVIAEFFADYTDLDKNKNISSTAVAYSYDQNSCSGRARFDYNNYRFYMSFNVQSEAQMMYYLQIFITQQ